MDWILLTIFGFGLYGIQKVILKDCHGSVIAIICSFAIGVATAIIAFG